MVKMVVCICPKSEDYDETIVSVASSQGVIVTCASTYICCSTARTLLALVQINQFSLTKHKSFFK